MISIRADCRTLSYKNRALRSGSIGKMQSRVNERRLRILGGSTLFGRRFVKLSRGVSISAKFGQNSVFESPIASLDLFFLYVLRTPALVGSCCTASPGMSHLFLIALTGCLTQVLFFILLFHFFPAFLLL